MNDEKKINQKILKVLSILAVVAMIVSCVAVLYSPLNESELSKGDNIISLEVPSFIGVASAGEVSESVQEGTTFLEEEAGISAYTNVGEEITLELAKTVFRTIERETDEYFIGSVPLPGYEETEDVHTYVHKDGWIVAYYLKKEPASKIVDWANYGTDEEMTGTKLENAIQVVCDGPAFLTMGDLNYYDFRYVNANRLMIVADSLRSDIGGNDSFNISLPDDLNFYERSYSHYSNIYYPSGSGPVSTMKLDGNKISTISGPRQQWVTETHYGLLDPLLLSPTKFHTVSLYQVSNRVGSLSFDAVVLVYQET